MPRSKQQHSKWAHGIARRGVRTPLSAACISPSSTASGELGLREALYEALVPKDVLAHVQQARWSPGHLGLARSQDGGVSASGSQHGTPGGSAPPSREPSYTNLSAAAQRGEGAPR